MVRIGRGGAAAEFVDGEGEGNEGEGEVETALPEFSGGLSGDWERRGRERGKVSKGGGERYTKGLIDGFGMRRMRGRLVCACGIGMPGGGVLTAGDGFVAALRSS